MARKRGESDVKFIAEWDPDSKEPWLLEFEKQPVNDEKWTCLVTSAIPAKIEDDECIQMYKQSMASGSGRSIKILSMSDVVNLVRGNGTPIVSIKGDKKPKGEKVERTQKKEENTPSPLLTQILNLVIKYATFNDCECKLPSSLMAALLKYMILTMKEDSIREKKINTVKERKIRERNLKAKFIKDQKPFDARGPKIPNENKYKNDAPVNGPDLYIMLTDFFDVSYYPALIEINVPLVAFLKIASTFDGMQMKKSSNSMLEKSDNGNKGAAICNFWKNLKENCNSKEKTSNFKDIAFMKYTPSLSTKHSNYSMINDEMSWLQYAAYRIYCQHQKYLRQVDIQKVLLSLKPLNLSKCEVYNKLCDALITGQPLTPLFVLYAMIEQMVAGVPETESAEANFDLVITDFFPTKSGSVTEESSISKSSTMNLVTPCAQCRSKVNDYVNVCRTPFDDGRSIEKSESDDVAAKESNDLSNAELMNSASDHSNSSFYSEESSSFTSLIDQVLSERKTKKDIRKEKKWKTPKVCFYGDSITLQTYHCDPRIIDPEELIDRFMIRSDLMKIWTKFPELSPGEKAYYNFHYNNFLKISQEKEETFRIKVHFALMMKIAGASKFYLFAGDEENLSVEASFGWKDLHKNSYCRKSHATFLEKINEQNSFSNFFVDSFILNLFNSSQRKTAFRIHNLKMLKFNDSWTSRKESNLYLAGSRGSVAYKPYNFLNLESLHQSDSFKKTKNILLPILDCIDISSLADFSYINQFVGFPKMVESFRYYEKLHAGLMVQKLVECMEDYNTVCCTYFPPTDTLAILMHNHSDHQGIFYRTFTGILPTPIALRDFYNHVYPEISQWLIDETAENVEFVSALEEEEKAKQEKKDEEFLAKLKFYYCQLSEEDRKNFLEQEIDFESEPEVTENELRDLPYKTQLPSRSEKKFVVTNFGNLRVEVGQRVHEFHSRDGSEVRAAFSNWTYDSSELLALTIRRFSLWLRYNMFLQDEEKNFTFTLKTASDIILAFFKEPENSTEEPRPFKIRISWPTGLLVEVKSISNPLDSNRYIKQSYIKIYRKGWEIEEEKSRCYLKNGEIIIIKESGNVKILTGSGTIHNIFYGEIPLYETITTTGEVWEQLIFKTKCRKKRKVSTLKVYLGVDCKTGETYYRRDDGTSCMLWPNGKLVTNYPDGTKITSTPDFDKEEVTVEWNEEEKQYFKELKSKIAGSRSWTRSRSLPQRLLSTDDFVSVSCTYLMEHPNYSAVYCENHSSLMEVRMLENIKIKTPSEGCYEVQKENNYLIVKGNVAQFETRCDECRKASTAVIDFDSDVLCHCIDLCENEFVVLKNGETIFRENTLNAEHLMEGCSLEKENVSSFCPKQHDVSIGLKQRCFLLERNLSGLEFIHEDNVARYCYDLKDETYFDLNTDNPNSLSHTFSSSLSKIGYEDWEMEYEKDDSLPTNLKKKDLRDIEVKENRNRLFKYPFPQKHDVAKYEKNNRPQQSVSLPKVKLVRTLKCLPFPGPTQVITDVRKYAEQYQTAGHDMCNKYKRASMDDYELSEYVKMRLRKIAITLSQTLTLYPHVCTQLPSTEKDVHYFGHLINAMEEIKGHFSEDDSLPKCKQIPRCLPRTTHFPTIHEE